MADLLEELVVRLTGDAAGYRQMLQQAGEATKTAAGIVEKTTEAFDKFNRSIEGFAQNALRSLAALGASSWLRQALGEFQSSEMAALKLNAALEAQGRDVVKLNKVYDAFAAKMQEVTTIEDDQVRSLLAQTENMGLSGEKAMRAVRNAIALASKSGDAANAGGFVRITAALEEGRVLTRVINPALANIKDNTQRVAAAQDLLAKMFKTAEAAAKSSSGAIKQLGVAYGNLLEAFGQVVAEGIHPVVSALKEVIKWVDALPQSIKEVIVLVLALSAGILALGPIVAIAKLLFFSLLNPVVIGLGLAAAGVALWTQAMGGVGKAMQWVKDQAEKAWDWIEPVRTALWSLFKEITDQAQNLWGSISGGAKGIFAGIFGNVDWSGIRDSLVKGIAVVEQVVRNLGPTFQKIWGDFISLATKAGESLGPLISWLGKTGEWIGRIVVANRGLIGTIAGIVIAFKIVQGALALTAAIAGALHLQQIGGIIAWGAWAIAVAAGTAVMWIFNTAMTVADFLLNGGVLALLEWAAAAVTAATATGLLDAAVALFESLTIVPLLIAVAFTAGVVAAAFVVLWGTVTGVVGAATDLFDLFANTGALAGPLATVAGIFGEWYGMVQAIIGAVQKDLPLAWEMVKAGASVAAQEAYAVWIALYPLLQSGFDTLWTYTSASFTAHFNKGVADAIDYLASKTDPFGLSTEQITAHQKKTLDDMNANLADASKKAQDALGGLAGKFAPDLNTKGIQDAKNAFKALADQVAALPDPKSQWDDWLKRMKDAAGKVPDIGKMAGENFGKAVKAGVASENIAYALYDSFEAMKNMAEYQERLIKARTDAAHGAGGVGGEGGGGGIGGGIPGLSTPSVVPSPSSGVGSMDTSLLTEIRDVLRNIDKKGGNPLQPANVGQGGGSFAI